VGPRVATHDGHAVVAQLLLVARCNIDLQTLEIGGFGVDLLSKDGFGSVLEMMQDDQCVGHTTIVTLIRNTKHEGDVRTLKHNGRRTQPQAYAAHWQ
jgi:hypothetical protein